MRHESPRARSRQAPAGARASGADGASPPTAGSAGRRFRAPHLSALGALVALPAAVAGTLAALGEGGSGAEVAGAVAGLALLGLAVALNELLRSEGLGGDGLTGAGGVLGASLVALVALSRAAGVPGGNAAGPGQPGLGALPLEVLAQAGWLLIGLWTAFSGRALARLVAPSKALAWGSAAGAAAIFTLTVADVLHVSAGDDPVRQAGLAFLPLALWAAGAAAACALGKAPAEEPSPE